MPTVKTKNLPGSYEYVGCIKEPDYPAPRVLPYKYVDSEAQSITQCLDRCSFYGFPVAAVEYGTSILLWLLWSNALHRQRMLVRR